MKKILFSIVLLLIILNSLHVRAQGSDPVEGLKVMTAQDEKDNILALVAASYVFQDWQKEGNSPRGYNIGAVLYDVQGDSIIGLNRNSIYQKKDKTQHAEIGLMQGYFQGLFCSTPQATLKGLQIVTTLEPCMMCSGMMIFLEVDTVKYVQADPEYGKNIERLAQDWMDAKGHVHPANDRCMSIKSVSLEGKCYLSAFLDKGYKKYKKSDSDRNMTGYLQTRKAHKIYKSADLLLRKWQVIYPENQKLLDHARKVLNLPAPAIVKSHAAEANYLLFRELWDTIK